MKFFAFLFSSIFVVSFFATLEAQHLTFNGKIFDSQTLEPLPFVTVILNNDRAKGSIANIDGEFSIGIEKLPVNLTFTYIGYKKLDYYLNEKNIQKRTSFFLQSDVINLNEVTVFPKENPAHRIIRLATENKPLNSPDNIDSFYCRIYNKTAFGIAPNRKYLTEEKYLELKQMADSTFALLMESIVNYSYKKPDRNFQEVEAIKVSGFKNPTFGPITTDIQPFHFYKDYLTIYDKAYLNPISKGSTNKYLFLIKDTLYDQADTIFIISFVPHKNSNFDGLKGSIYINSNRYAIQNISAQPADTTGLIDIMVSQKYQFLAHHYWFPEEMNFELRYKKYPSKSYRIVATGKSFVSNVDFEPDQSHFKKAENEVAVNDSSIERDDNYWNKMRFKLLDQKEKTTYSLIDSVGKLKNFDKKLYILEKLIDDKIPFGWMDITLTKLLEYNPHEGNRFCLDLHTNQHFLKHFRLGAYSAYGIGDHKWKYGANFSIFNSQKDWNFEFSYRKDLTDPNYFIINFEQPFNYLFSWMSYLKNSSEEWNGALSFKINYLRFKTGFSQQSIQTQFDSIFIKEPIPYMQQFRFTEAFLQLKFAYNEKIVPAFGQKFSLGTDFPIVYLAFVKGLNNLLDGQYNYTKMGFSIEKSITIRHVGTSNFYLEGAIIEGKVPVCKLFEPKGSFLKGSPYFIKNSFNTMKMYEFQCDRYILFSYSHNFGRLLLNNQILQPEIIIIQNSGFGDLSPTYSSQIKTINKGYFETGLMMNNLFKFNIANFTYLGFGGGVFYRYGKYSYSVENENFAFKMSVSLSF